MNYLSHILLSGTNTDILIGNFIGDSVKGNDFESYTKGVANGIKLHREIDSFMDQHPIVRQGILRLRPNYGKFSGIVIDMFYDYFLAKNWTLYSEIPFQKFVNDSYSILEKHQEKMPLEAKFILARMIDKDWLTNYLHTDGIDRALKGLSRRTRFANNMNRGVEDLLRFEAEFNNEFNEYFPLIQQYCNSFIKKNG